MIENENIEQPQEQPSDIAEATSSAWEQKLVGKHKFLLGVKIVAWKGAIHHSTKDGK